jgi:hypothetical protein
VCSLLCLGVGHLACWPAPTAFLAITLDRHNRCDLLQTILLSFRALRAGATGLLPRAVLCCLVTLSEEEKYLSMMYSDGLEPLLVDLSVMYLRSNRQLGHVSVDFTLAGVGCQCVGSQCGPAVVGQSVFVGVCWYL